MKKYKVFSLGQNQINFIGQLYGAIQQLTNKFIFDIDFFDDNSKGKTPTQRELYNDFYALRKTKVPKFQGFLYVFKLFLNPSFYPIFWFELTHNPKKIGTTIKKNTRNLYITNTITANNHHHIFHVHSCSPINLKYITYLPKSAKTIVSFWGLDLYQYTGKTNHFYIALALNKATIITLQNEEMKRYLLSKYGEHLQSKLRVVRFPLQTAIFESIDTLKLAMQQQEDFKKRFHIPLDKIVVTVGYNAHENHQHLKILKALNTLETSLKQQIVVLLPLMYGRQNAYLQELKAYQKTTNGLTFAAINDYLNWDEVALLKLISNVTIQMPKNDALSASVIEAMYTTNIVMNASWLPYSSFKESNINFVEVKNYETLAAQVTSVLSNLTELKAQNQKNINSIQQEFISGKEAKSWLAIYNSLV